MLGFCKNQKWLADTLGINKSQLSDILNGKCHGKKTTAYVKQICKVLNISEII
ncbi:MAG TPA: helix-turn-helix transcriptional regulator [Candidatus Levilactobacillus faecigallinarum]|uniref:Helix-turn-helix transcriptional regulator n=1 Tax=Candidatus Levilactobacillus faecigallinarum TaxID=2838638 RepID=A0A9D1QSQ6_9LACO|nr:helix-turn-helix transcriptional regulator [Candidatus Levilactobacillus faecigallinarum]